MRRRWRKIGKALVLALCVALLAVGLIASRIYSFRNVRSEAQADAAVVLGAAVWSADVSPVFRERINHGIDLYRKGMLPVNKLMSAHLALDQINEGFDALAGGHTVRQIIVM